MKCDVCGGQMTPMISSWFCPRDCDRRPTISMYSNEAAEAELTRDIAKQIEEEGDFLNGLDAAWFPTTPSRKFHMVDVEAAYDMMKRIAEDIEAMVQNPCAEIPIRRDVVPSTREIMREAYPGLFPAVCVKLRDELCRIILSVQPMPPACGEIFFQTEPQQLTVDSLEETVGFQPGKLMKRYSEKRVNPAYWGILRVSDLP